MYFTLKQMLQITQIALTQVKAGNTTQKSHLKSVKSYILCIERSKLLKKCVTL